MEFEAGQLRSHSLDRESVILQLFYESSLAVNEMTAPLNDIKTKPRYPTTDASNIIDSRIIGSFSCNKKVTNLIRFKGCCFSIYGLKALF